MSDRYSFVSDGTLITHDGSVVWNEQVSARPSLDFTESTLTDSINDSYATAVEDSDNETQYLSVLETTNDITLEDLHNLTLGNSKIEMQEGVEYIGEHVLENAGGSSIDIGEQQVMLFTLDGSDDLYGIQFVQDDEGNLQKCQFKFRTTEDGQLEAIPESIQLLPNDEESTEEINEVMVQEIQTEETVATPVIYQEAEVEDYEVDEPGIYMQEEDATEEYVQLEQQNGDLRVYIKGEQFIKGEHDTHDSCETRDDEQQEFEECSEDDHNTVLRYEEHENEPQQDECEEDIIETKPGILEGSLNSQGNIKEEFIQEETQDAPYIEETEDYQEYQCDDNSSQYEENIVEEGRTDDTNILHPVEGENYTTIEIDGTHETVLEYEQYVPEEGIQHVYEVSDTTESQHMQSSDDNYQRLFIQEPNIDDNEREVEMEPQQEEDGEGEQYAIENDSDNDDYQIVEGLHITAEGDLSEEAPHSPHSEPETILQEVVEKPTIMQCANVLKQASFVKHARDIKPKNNHKTVVYYLVPQPEKENVNSLTINNTNVTSRRAIKSHPRTILKSSFPEIEENPDLNSLADERFNKRFARSKEAVQARLFNNFISKTTIPHAPVRKTRLPRKQQIKPVDNRRNEEIIVQEVMVSSKGFIEDIGKKLRNKDKLEVTEYVVLSDSDDDNNLDHDKYKKKKQRKHRKMPPDDVESSDASVIEIHSDDDSEENVGDVEKDTESPRRGRGRPKKGTNDGGDNVKRRRGRPPKPCADPDESPTKKSRTESDEEPSKQEVKCPHCPKTFPSQNSLATHIQHHNLENSLRNKAVAQRAPVEYKHKCDDCQATFKNSILLKRHVCDKKVMAAKVRTRIECIQCKKTFPDVHTLNVHKRTHVKEHLVHASVVGVSPKKCLPRPSTSRMSTTNRNLFKSPPEQTVDKTHKCKVCSRVCYSKESLALHEKTHRKFTCMSCNASFPSRLLLDTHIRVSCVKHASPKNKRLSFKVRKSFMHSPRRKSGRFGKKSLMNSTNLNETATSLSSSKLELKLECNHCGEKFTMFQDKFKHQVKVHGLETPDRSILAEQKKRLHKPKNIHGGIPAREGMLRVFADIKTKIALVTPTKEGD